MKLQTNIPLSKESYNPIDYDAKLLLLGSCFSENVGQKLNYFKFQSAQNPFGILFHPKAIETLITNTINSKEYADEDVFFLNERWHCFDAHSQLSSPSKEDLLDNLNGAILQTKQQLNESTHIIITLGTSWVYRFIESDLLVANCHKVPQKKFLKEILTIDQISESLESIIALIRDINPNVNFIFTVSPVRHLKDGFVENQQSKAHLISAIHQIADSRKKIHYFPSYEIMMDELRDYRFYAEDMIHPNQTAINYIWEKFSAHWLTENTQTIVEEVDRIQRGLNHRPFNANSEEHQKFKHTIQQKITTLKELHPHITF